MEEITAFKDFGFPAVAFGAMWILIKSLIVELRAMNESADKRINEQSNRHNEERKHWQDSVDKMTSAIERLFEKPCQTSSRNRAVDRTEQK